MRKLLTLTAMSLCIYAVKAQQDPQFTHFFMNRLNYNPAFAGTEQKICGMLMYRTQWQGFGGSGKNDLGVSRGESPETFIGNINAPIGQRLGVGFNIYRDRQGFESTVVPSLSVSYRHTFANESQLSGGVNVGMVQKTLDGSKFSARDAGDSKVPTGTETGTGIDFGAGVYFTMPTLWRFDRFYTGLSLMHINQANVAYNTIENKMVHHYYFMAGAAYDINGTFAIEPNVLVKSILSKTSADINAMVVYNNRFKGGISWRTEDAFSILAGFKFTDDMQLGYSYDLTTSNIIDYSTGSHEIFFKYCFMPKIKTKEKIVIPRLTPRFL
ncbi:MAG: type IX secretion system membrane protein PorP/SprF [Bacteroidota bacterium]